MTASCEEVLAQIELYIDGEIDDARRAELAGHLGTCSPCMDRAEFQARLKEIVRFKCRSQTPEHLMAKIRDHLRAESPHEG